MGEADKEQCSVDIPPAERVRVNPGSLASEAGKRSAASHHERTWAYLPRVLECHASYSHIP